MENCDDMQDNDCWEIIGEIMDPDNAPDPPNLLVLAAMGQSEVKDSSFGYGVAVGVSIGAVLSLTALFAMKKCSKKHTYDDYIRA